MYIYTRYPPEKRNGEECEARGSEIGGRGSCAQDPLDGYKTSCPQRRPFRIYRRSSATRASHLDDGKKKEREKKKNEMIPSSDEGSERTMEGRKRISSALLL